MTIVHLHMIIRLPCSVDEAIPLVYRWLPWVLIREHLRRAGAVELSVGAEAS